MDELVGKVITGIIIAILIFVLQSLGVHKLILGIVGGSSPPILEEVINGSSKKEEIFWASVDKCGTYKCYQLYLEEYPQGNFSSIAKLQLNNQVVKSKLTTASRPVVVKTSSQPKKKFNEKNIKHYIVYDNGTAYDTKKDLLWMRCAIGQKWTGSNCFGRAKTFLWEEAVKQTTSFAGYSDWRLPTIKELRNLVYCSNGQPNYFPMGKYFDTDRRCMGKPNKDYKSPTILQSVFPNTKKTLYWSSSLGTRNTSAWGVYFPEGSDLDATRLYFPIRLVRSKH